MPDKKDNIVTFKPKGEKPADPNAQAKRDMMESILAGANNLRKKVRNQHFIYYISILIGFLVVLTVYFTMIIGLMNAN